MDILSTVKVDLEILREPRGFMRLVQLVLSIFAFGTVTSVRTSSHVIVNCGKNNITDETVIRIPYGYPFRISKTASVMLPFCSDNQQLSSDIFTANFSSSAEFFCFIAVMSFLMYLVLVPGYVLFGSFFSKSTLGAKLDFIISSVWTLFWFISSTAWAANLSKLTNYMSPENLIDELGDYCDSPYPCRPGWPGDHSTLVVSVLFGFLNMGITGTTLWFLFKETEWHKDSESDPSAYADPGYQTAEYTDDPTIPETSPAAGMQPTYGDQSSGQFNSGPNDFYNANQPPTY